MIPVMQSVRREAGHILKQFRTMIATKERELEALKREYARYQALGLESRESPGAPKAPRAPKAPTRQRQRQGRREVQWSAVLDKLPAQGAFSVTDVMSLSGKPRDQVYVRISQWKKAGVVRNVEGGYERIVTNARR